MARATILILCWFACMTLAFGFPWDRDSRDYGEELNDVEQQDTPNVQRRNDWCARWGDICVPNAKVRFAKCCDDLVCNCAYTSSKCQCKRPAILG